MFDSFLQRFSSVAFFFLTKYCFWFIWILFMWVSTGRFAVFVHTACFNESGDFIFHWFHSNFVLTFLPPASPFVHNHSVFKWLWRLHFWLILFKFCLWFLTPASPFVHTACFNDSGDFIFDWFHSNFVFTFLLPASPFVHTACFSDSGDFIFDWFHSNFVFNLSPSASPFAESVMWRCQQDNLVYLCAQVVFKWAWRFYVSLISLNLVFIFLHRQIASACTGSKHFHLWFIDWQYSPWKFWIFQITSKFQNCSV